MLIGGPNVILTTMSPFVETRIPSHLLVREQAQEMRPQTWSTVPELVTKPVESLVINRTCTKLAAKLKSDGFVNKAKASSGSSSAPIEIDD